MENNQNPFPPYNNDDNLVDLVSKKGHLTINQNHYGDSFDLLVLNNEPSSLHRPSKLESIFNIIKVATPALKTIGKIASFSSPLWAPRLMQKAYPRLMEYREKQLRIGESNKKLTSDYRENLKLESKSGKYEIFAESSNYHPLTDYLAFKLEKRSMGFEIGLEYLEREENIFTKKFLPYLKRDDVVIYYSEKFMDIEKKCEKSIIYKIEKAADKTALLYISIHGLSVTQTENKVEEIPNDRIEIIE